MMEPQIPPKKFKEAGSILSEGKGKLNQRLEEIENKVKANSKYSSLALRWSQILNYFFSGQVPMGKKVKFLALLLYLVSPMDLLPGPIDDMIVAAWMIPALDKELNRYVQGEYDKENTTETKTPFDFMVDEDELFSSSVRRNPFLIDEEELS